VIRSTLNRLRVQLARIRDPESFKRHAMVGPAQHWKAMREFQIDFLKRQGLQPTDTFVDIGCGTLRGGIPVIEYLGEGNYTGLDVRDEALEEGRKELARFNLEAKRPELLNSTDFDTLHSAKVFDKAWAFAALIHMSDDIVAKAFAWVGRYMKPDGIFFADVKLGPRQDADRKGRQFPVVTRPLEFYADLGRQAGFPNVEDLGSIESLGHRTGMQGDKRHMLRFSR
jgi:SAM-dependent methyltransferase